MGWLVSRQKLVSDESNLEIDPVFNWKPVKVLKASDMFSSRKSRVVKNSFS